MVTDATKKLREPVAYILLAFVALFTLASLIRLFAGGAGFTAAAGSVQGFIVPPGLSALVVLFALVAAVWLVNEGERTPNARTVALAALVLTGVIVLIGLITAFAGFSETSTAGLKVVGFVYALSGLALYGAAGLYIMKTFQALPAPVRAPKPGQFAQQGQGQFGGQPGQQYGQTAPYGQQQGQYGQQGQQGQYGGQYDQGQQGQGQYGGYAGAAGAGAAGGYAAAQGDQQQWPQEQSWGQGEQHNWSAGEAEGQHQSGEQAWSSEGQQQGQHGTEPTQAWSSEGQQQWGGQEQGQQWPQEQQWGGQDAGQQQWGQEYGQQPQHAQQGQQEWGGQQEHAAPAADDQAAADAQPAQTWSQEQAWPAAAEETPAAEPQTPQAQPEQETPAADETRIDPQVADANKDDQNQQPGQNQQGWWSQPS